MSSLTDVLVACVLAQFYPMEVAVDFPLLVLSVGRSILPVDAALPVRPVAEPRAALPGAADLDDVRVFLATARQLEHTMDAAVLADVEVRRSMCRLSLLLAMGACRV